MLIWSNSKELNLTTENIICFFKTSLGAGLLEWRRKLISILRLNPTITIHPETATDEIVGMGCCGGGEGALGLQAESSFIILTRRNIYLGKFSRI